MMFHTVNNNILAALNLCMHARAIATLKDIIMTQR